MLRINSHLTIPDEELQFTFSRSSGPGGQNVNKVNSKATLHWNVTLSTALPDAVRQRFLTKFHNRITRDGELVLSSQQSRDQPKNVADCLEKLAEMIHSVLRPPKPRRATKPTRGSRERRLQAKRQLSAKKTQRRGEHRGD